MKTVRPVVRLWIVVLAGMPQGFLPCATSAFAQTPIVRAPSSSPAAATAARPAGEAAARGAAWPGPASDQAQSAALDTLRRDLRPGDHVSIVWTTGDPVMGRVMRVGETDLEVRTEPRSAVGRNGERRTVTIPLDAIQSLERPRDSSKDGLLIGAAVGAGFSAALFAHAYAIDANEMDEWAGGYLAAGVVFTGLGALVGWGIDTVHSKPRLRYRAPAHPGVTVAIAPLPSRGLGLVVAFTF